MKSKLLLFSLFTFLISNIGIAQTEWKFTCRLLSPDKIDTIQIFMKDNSSPPRIESGWSLKIESRTETIKEIQIEGATSEKQKDGTYLIKLIGVYKGLRYTFIGSKIYKFNTISTIPLPDFFYLSNLFPNTFDADPSDERLRYTIDDFIRNGKINICRYNKKDTLYKVAEFKLSFYDRENKIRIESPLFNGDSISFEFINSLRKYFTGPSETGMLFFRINYLMVIDPDLRRLYCNSSFPSAMIFKDSAHLLLQKYNLLNGQVVKSDIRIKVEGSPKPEDLETIKKIVTEFNSLQVNIKAKLVNFLPSAVIHFDTSASGRKLIASKQKMDFKVNPVFPRLSHSELFMNTELKDPRAREMMLWDLFTRRTIANFGNNYPANWAVGIINPGARKLPGFTEADKIVIKEVLSDNYYKSAKLLGGTMQYNINRQIILYVFVSMILFLIVFEINSFFNFGRFVKNAFLLNSIYFILIAQLLIITKFFVNKYFINDLLQSEAYFIGFMLVTGWLFFTSDRIIKKYISINWLKLTLNPVFTLISLYLAYQFIYLFVRAEFLRFITIDINAIIIALSIIAVRFYLQYFQSKLTSLLQEKEYELTLQRELKNRAELSTLQAKINPHFLYNALNSIAALAHIDSTRTEEMALSLSKLFRYNMNREEDMNSTIRQEIEMVQLYLQIEKQRFADRLTFEVSITENLYERQVPRFLIQPLVENAIKHGVSEITGQGIIKLKIYEEGKSLLIEIHDNGPQFPEGLVTGYGLQNTYDKLTLVYKKPYEVRFVNEPDKYIQIKL